MNHTPETSLYPRLSPQLWNLDPEITFLNHGSFGACPAPVLALQAELRAQMEAEPVRFFVREAPALLDQARHRLASFLGAKAENLAMVPNATFAVSSVLASLDLSPGDELLFLDHGYNACKNALRHFARRLRLHPVEVVLPDPVPSPESVVESILEKVTPRTRLAMIDHITSPSALVLPLPEIVAALRDRGIETLVDGAHTPGQIPLDLESLGAAYHTGNLHKWLCTPRSATYLYVRPDLAASLYPAVISHGLDHSLGGQPLLHTRFDWLGTLDPTPALCLPAALETLASLLPGGMPALMERNHSLALAARHLLVTALGARPVGPEGMVGAMATLEISPDPCPTGSFDSSTRPGPVLALQTRLLEDFGIEIPVFYSLSGPPRRFLRLSCQAYNGFEDYLALARAVGEAGGAFG